MADEPVVMMDWAPAADDEDDDVFESSSTRLPTRKAANAATEIMSFEPHPHYAVWIDRFYSQILSHINSEWESMSAVQLMPMEMALAESRLTHKLETDWRCLFTEETRQELEQVHNLYSLGMSWIAKDAFLAAHDQLMFNTVCTHEDGLAVALWMTAHLLTRVLELRSISNMIDLRVVNLACLMSPRCFELAKARLHVAQQMRVGVVTAVWPLVDQVLTRKVHHDWAAYLRMFRGMKDTVDDCFDMCANYRRRVSMLQMKEARGSQDVTGFRQRFEIEQPSLKIAMASLTDAMPLTMIDQQIAKASTADHKGMWRHRKAVYLDSRASSINNLALTSKLPGYLFTRADCLWAESREIAEALRNARKTSATL